ncbi:hypothetical protein tinsulaeT_19040 [Thalassotalea insulae]|uniref:Uncharacterized protein n=1 Tax=Thalassotalea insulae TaxID=2056778 RepID=A0ABQ6GTS8_9GAMM|nr:hypothetical protein [Thalassotalea insulae]GLX78564.1 hypothetical protein tinsulaeT_19040 [Thalassotalea insulae]
MKYLFNFFLLIFATTAHNAKAQQITVESALLACKDKTQVHENFPFNYRYGVDLVLKNTSDQNLTIATNINSATTMFNKENIYQVSLNHQMVKHGDNVIIPPTSTLQLVELYPGEFTSISYQFSHNALIEQAKLEFIATESLANRFNLWQGRALSPAVKTRIMHKCKT